MREILDAKPPHCTEKITTEAQSAQRENGLCVLCASDDFFSAMQRLGVQNFSHAALVDYFVDGSGRRLCCT